ncbi:MAG TPA: multiheme c-type cytochrome [Kofleriaceae bacterium]|nr:multiheme c-type cytochrome [Kofleriaceae bacterium]
MLRDLVLLVAAALAAPAAPAAPSRFTGVDACATCHQEIAASWRRTGHARALERLRPAEAASGRCRSCHATGEAPAGRSDLPGVQCEACHGAGAGYAPEDVMRDPLLARALGLRDLSTPARRAAVCARCHRAGTRLAPFDPEAAWRRIAH